MKISYIIFCLFVLIGCSITKNNSRSDNNQNLSGSFKVIKIENLNWMSENLDVTTFRNGDVIPQAKSTNEWLEAAKNKKPVWCYLGDDREIGIQPNKFGKLYNWYAVDDKRGLAPTGWRIPHDSELSLIKDKYSIFIDDIVGDYIKSNGQRTFTDYEISWWAYSDENQPSYWFRWLYGDEKILEKRDGSEDLKMCGFNVRCVKD